MIEEKDIKHLEWLYARLNRVYKENEHYNYMLKFKEIIEKLKTPEQVDASVHIMD